MTCDRAAAHDLRRVGVEHPVIVGLAVLREGFVNGRVGGESRGLEARLDHAQAAGREDGATERTVGLQADDHLVVAVDPARVVGEQGRRPGRIDVEHALLALLVEIGLQLRPYRLGPLRGTGEERFVAVVRRHVAQDEVANIDRALPAPRHRNRAIRAGHPFR